MMGLESDPKDGKVVAGSIFWAVLVYAVRASPSFLWWPAPPPSPVVVVVGKITTRLILGVVWGKLK